MTSNSAKSIYELSIRLCHFKQPFPLVLKSHWLYH